MRHRLHPIAGAKISVIQNVRGRLSRPAASVGWLNLPAGGWYLFRIAAS
jgi:hypothetical protein